MKEIIDQLDLMKIKNFCSAKDTVKRMRRQSTDWEKIFTKDISDKELFSKIYKAFLKLNNKKKNILSKKMVQGLLQTPHQKIMQMTNKH